jgi:hypothetical protein
MTTCSILITDTGPLKTLAYAGELGLLLKTGLPIYVTDMVIVELQAGSQYVGNQLALDFIDQCLAAGDDSIQKIDTGVPQNAALLKSMRVDPGEHSLKIALEDYCATHPGQCFVADNPSVPSGDGTAPHYHIGNRCFESGRDCFCLSG